VDNTLVNGMSKFVLQCYVLELDQDTIFGRKHKVLSSFRIGIPLPQKHSIASIITIINNMKWFRKIAVSRNLLDQLQLSFCVHHFVT
jgi:hypothetical protein